MTAEELRDLLGQSRKSQGWLAEQVGVRPNTVWRWANGNLPIPASRDEQMSAVLLDAIDEGGPAYVYRIFDADDALLYVGASGDPKNRLSGHRGRQSWGDRIARMESVQYPSRRAALRAEAEAIVAERPEFNVMGHPDRNPQSGLGADEFGRLLCCADRTPAWLGRRVGVSRTQVMRWTQKGVPGRHEKRVRALLPPLPGRR